LEHVFRFLYGMGTLARLSDVQQECPTYEFSFGLAPPSQQREFWQIVPEQMGKRASTRPFRLSTAGMGVSWLHVRLDDHPKYYAWKPYKSC